MSIIGGRRQQDFPPGLQGGLEHDDEDHRLGETGQVGPESPGDVDRSHPQPRGGRDDGAETNKKPPAKG